MAESELTDLQDLVASPGWARLRDHAKQTWVVQFYTAVERLLDSPDSDVAAKARQAAAARRAVDTLLGWPEERIGTIKRGEDKPALGRRGAL